MSIRLFDIAFTPGRAADLLRLAAAHPPTRPRLIVTANLDHVVTLADNAAFREAYDAAVARTLDGMPLVWLARLRGAREVVRVTGHDLIAAAMAAPWPAGQRIFLVCAIPAVGDYFVERLVAAGLERDAVAVTVPPFGFEEDEAYGEQLAGAIRRHGTTLLVLGVGAPRSEIWVTRQGAALGGPVVLAVGEALNVAAGLVPRAPLFMQRIGMEWFFRFLHAPRRLFGRYFLRSWRLLGIALRALRDRRRKAVVTGAPRRGTPGSS